MEQLIGQCLGHSTGSVERYQIKSLLGKQIGRRTFLADDLQTKTQVVIKLVLFGPDFAWEQLKLFQREAQTLQSLQHPAIPRYLDSFDVDTPLGKGFALVQTYIEARSLQAWVSAGHTFGEGDLRVIATSLLNILTYLHQRHPPVIHRDIKPSNILLPSKGDPTAGGLYLVDFGSVQTAPSSGTMTVVGTYGYMPPEQFGGRAQPASDLYSLGATLIYLSTGQHPAELTQDNLQIAFEPPDNLSPAFARWIRQLTYTDLSKRTASASQALHQLNNPSPAVEPAVPTAIQAHRESDLSFRSVHKDFVISATPHEFEVQFSSLRLERAAGSSWIFWLSVFSWIYASIVATQMVSFSFFILIVGGVLCVAVSLLIVAFRNREKRDSNSFKTAHLRLREISEGSMMLDLAVTSHRYGSEKCIEQFSDAPLVKVASGLFGKSVIFDCERKASLQRRAVAVAATSEDIRWLFQSLDRWTDSLGAEKYHR